MNTKSDLHIGDHRVDVASGEVFLGGARTAQLRRQSLDVLLALAGADGTVLPKDDAIAQVWGTTNVTDDSLVQCIAEIRRALGPDRRFLETVPRQGYRLTLAAPAPSPAVTSTVAAAAPSKPSDTRIKLLVAPFTCASSDEELGYFADGLTADLTDALTHNSDIIVLSHPSQAAPHDAAAALGAHYISRGLVRQSGARLIVNAALEHVAGGATTLSKRLEGDVEDAIALQEQLSMAIANEICMHLAGAYYTKSFFALTGDAADFSAWRLLVQALPHMNQFQDLAQRQIARRLIRRSLEIDPDYVGALIALGDLEYLDWRLDPFWSNIDEGLQAVERGLRMYPEDAALHATLARLKIVEADWDGVSDHAARALELQPNNTLIMHNVAYAYGKLGRNEEALQLCDMAEQLDPRRTNESHATKAGCLLNMFRFEEALALLDAMHEKNPQVRWIESYRAIAAYHLGLMDRADAHFARFMTNQTDANNHVPNTKKTTRDPRVDQMKAEAEAALHARWIAGRSKRVDARPHL